MLCIIMIACPYKSSYCVAVPCLGPQSFMAICIDLVSVVYLWYFQGSYAEVSGWSWRPDTRHSPCKGSTEVLRQWETVSLTLFLPVIFQVHQCNFWKCVKIVVKYLYFFKFGVNRMSFPKVWSLYFKSVALFGKYLGKSLRTAIATRRLTDCVLTSKG